METLLKVVQRVVTELGEDRVSSIYSSDESHQVATIAVDAYSTILSEYPFVVKQSIIAPEHIDGTIITIPNVSQRIKLIKYIPSNKCNTGTQLVEDQHPELCEWLPKDSWNSCVNRTYFIPNFAPKPLNCNPCTELTYKPVEEFLSCTCNRSGENVEVEGTRFSILNNKDPEFWTTINHKIILDSYCKEDGSKILRDRLTILGDTVPSLDLADSAVIDLPVEVFNYFLAEVKSLAFYTIKGVAHEKYENTAQRLRRALLRGNGLQDKKRTEITKNYGAVFRRSKQSKSCWR